MNRIVGMVVAIGLLTGADVNACPREDAYADVIMIHNRAEQLECLIRDQMCGLPSAAVLRASTCSLKSAAAQLANHLQADGCPREMLGLQQQMDVLVGQIEEAIGAAARPAYGSRSRFGGRGITMAPATRGIQVTLGHGGAFIGSIPAAWDATPNWRPQTGGYGGPVGGGCNNGLGNGAGYNNGMGNVLPGGYGSRYYPVPGVGGSGYGVSVPQAEPRPYGIPGAPSLPSPGCRPIDPASLNWANSLARELCRDVRRLEVNLAQLARARF